MPNLNEKTQHPENEERHSSFAPGDENEIDVLRQQLNAYKKEKEILLALSDDITKAREKSDLVRVLSSRLKAYFYFTHAVISLIDKQKGTYFPFLLDRASMQIKHRSELPSLLKMNFPIGDPFIRKIAESEVPVSFLLDEIINEPGIPAFLKVNYDCGIKKAMIGRLKDKTDTVGFIFIYSDRTDSFPDDFINIIHGIAPHLSNAVANIITNEEIVEKDKDKSFLIEFSHEIAFARTKDELSWAIHQSLKKLAQVRAYFIRTINEDGLTLSPFIHDDEVHYKNDPEFKKLLNTKIQRTEGLTERVLRGNVPVLIDFEEEVKQGNTDHYIEFWKGLGTEKPAFQTMIGIPLRTGNRDLGILWVISDSINMVLLEGISAQMSVAISNIGSNEEIAQRQEEKTTLLSLSTEIAALRRREDLERIVNTKIKSLFSINDFGFLQINDDQTYSTFTLDLGSQIRNQTDFAEVESGRYSVKDPIFTRMMDSEDPIILDVNKLAEDSDMPKYVYFWQKIGLQRVLGTALRVGGKEVGCAFLHIDENQTGELKINLLKAVFAQISVAISNIRGNEEIIERENEKSVLLSLSDEIAALRSRNDLLEVVNTKIKDLFHIEEFGIAQINEDGLSYSAFVMDLGHDLKSHVNFKDVTSATYKVTDPVFSSIMASEDPIILNVKEMMKQPGVPSYVDFWNSAGLHEILGAALRVGGKNIACAFLHVKPHSGGVIKNNLLKAVCAQLAVAIANILANEKVLSFKRLLEVENDHLKEQIKTIYNYSEIIGAGDAMQKVYRLMSLVADSNTTVLVLGETGTGKELIARAIHNTSTRKDKLMVKVNCAALPANLIESELFGHERGAFTGAIDRRIGKFELANQSTLFLDEIGELPLEAQSKLLRVIQERELERVGGKQTIKVDVRLIAATNRNLDDEVKAGRFRADLYFRLNVFPVTLPPLRDRSDDIEALTHFFVQKYSRNAGRQIRKVSPKVIQQLRSYTWPGNVRELQHMIERSILLTTNGVLEDVFIPQSPKGENTVRAHLLNRSMEEVERDYIIETLRRCAGKISGTGSAAEILKVPGNTLHSKMKKLGISKSDYFSK
jgi:formate hydrogenlyase transcriptional activator